MRELAGYPNFIVWRYCFLDEQKKKPPFDPNTYQAASPTNRNTWGSLDSALSALASGQFTGIGFILSHSPFGGIDLDHSVQNGMLVHRAKDIVDAMDTYTDYSPSFRPSTGTGGIHLLFEGKPPSSKKVGNIEVYGEKHYLTITTNHIPRTPTTIHPRQEALDALYRKIAPPVEERVTKRIEEAKEELRAELATKEQVAQLGIVVHNVEVKLTRKVHGHERRIDEL